MPDSKKKLPPPDLTRLKQLLKMRLFLRKMRSRAKEVQDRQKMSGGSDTSQMMQQAQQERAALKDQDLH